MITLAFIFSLWMGWTDATLWILVATVWIDGQWMKEGDGW